jgi:hypothetical protein
MSSRRGPAFSIDGPVCRSRSREGRSQPCWVAFGLAVLANRLEKEGQRAQKFASECQAKVVISEKTVRRAASAAEC